MCAMVFTNTVELAETEAFQEYPSTMRQFSQLKARLKSFGFQFFTFSSANKKRTICTHESFSKLNSDECKGDALDKLFRTETRSDIDFSSFPAGAFDLNNDAGPSH